MEKLQVAIEQARQRREGKKGGSQPPKTPGGGRSGEAASRKRPGPRLLPDDLMNRWMALPEITLPRTPGDARRLVAQTPGLNAAHYDVLRTKLLIELRKNGWRRVAITSPTGNCGKSTTACNLALAIARQGDLRTSLFDLDLRRPAVARLMGSDPRRDISEFLKGEIAYGDQAMRVGPNLAVSMALHHQADPTQLLAGERTAELIDEIEKSYAPDVMIFDLPPLLAADDARAFLRNVDCAILMAQAEVTTAQQIDICEREIAEQTNVLGIVLNQCRFDAGPRGNEEYGYTN